MQRGRHSVRKAVGQAPSMPGMDLSQVWMSAHPIGKVIVPLGSHVHPGGPVCDPARHYSHLPPSMAVPQPIETLGD